MSKADSLIRYDCGTHSEGFCDMCFGEMEPSKNGDYVEFDQVEAIIKLMESGNDRLRQAEKLLWQVSMTINHCLNTEKNLPDSFDEQLMGGIRDYFKAS